jgi:molecular chaperone GrpE
MDADYPATPGGFTFADKRKINPDGGLRPPSGGAEPAPVSADTEPAEPEILDAPAAEDPNALLAAERLLDLPRLQAEYANYRKRVDRDRNVARESAIASVLESLLPVLDDIHLARQHGDLESGPFASIAEKLESTVGKYGVERYGAPGEAFDPAVHEALMHVEAELAEGTEVTTVVSVLQPGYLLGERVVRPARVSVADPA